MMQKSSSPARCRACQLQLCKSRSQAPHASLTEVQADQSSRLGERHFRCQACGTTLANSDDCTIAGWRSIGVAAAAAASPA
jgi:hypothetical protein